MGLCAAGVALAQTPDPDRTRSQIDAVIGRGADAAPATLGRIAEVAALSIQYGAPAYNEGNIEGCRSFYRRSMVDLLAAWEKAPDPDPSTREALAVVREALDRSAYATGPEPAAWSLRYGWDRVFLLVSTDTSEIEGLVKMGVEYLGRGELGEAESAFRAAAARSDQVLGSHPTEADLAVRMPRMALGHALFAAARYADAAEAVAAGLALVPDWLDLDIDRAALHGGPPYPEALAALERAASEDRADALELRFLLAYEYAMSGDTRKSDQLLQAILEAKPDHSGARLLAAGLERRKRR
jgi:tetratricopeptide (TPR) repeat protein